MDLWMGTGTIQKTIWEDQWTCNIARHKEWKDMPVKYFQIFGIVALLLSLVAPPVFAQSSWDEWTTLNEEIQKLSSERQYNRAVTAAEQELEAAVPKHPWHHERLSLSITHHLLSIIPFLNQR